MSQPKEQQVYILIEPEGSQDGVIVKWQRGVTRQSWPIPGAIETIKKRAESIRTELTAVRDVYTRGNPSRDYKAVLVPTLVKVAQQGHLLYKYLFDPAPNEVKKWLKQQEAQKRPVSIILSVSLLLKLHAPWGLMFSRPLANEGDRITESDLRRHFWAIKHRLATVLQGDIREVSFPEDATTADSDSLLCRSVMRQVKAKLGDFYKSGRVLHEWPPLLLNRNDRNRCLYFFCHSTMTSKEDKLSLLIHDAKNNVSIVDSAEFGQYAGTDRTCAEIVFFNSCDTARFQEDTKWLVQAWRNGLRGFVGTEVEVPSAAAWKFGIDFLEHLFSGRSVLETMESLRFKEGYWPLTLLYGIYADPEFSLRTV
jgi:hypothetical protein